jgi:uncharacterized membrane protein YkvA (DUF1232 family)
MPVENHQANCLAWLMHNPLDEQRSLSGHTISPPQTEQGGSWIRQQLAKGNDGLHFVVRQTRIMMLVLKHPGVPWFAKVVAGCSVGYIFSPIQLIPSFIPVIGQLDDLAVLFVGMKLLRKLTPAAIFADCEAQAVAKTFAVDPEKLPAEDFRRHEAAL